VPDFIRIPILANYVAKRKIQFGLDIRDVIQKTVDSIARKELEDTSKIRSPVLMPIPNAAANFLNRYSSTGDMKASFRHIRKEYNEHNKTVTEWEKRQFDPEINQEKKDKLNKEIAETLRDSLAENEKTMAIVQAAFGFVFHPSLTSAVPPAKVIWDLIKKYRAKRRIWYFLQGKREAALIKEQPHILERVFGKSLNEGQLARFKDLVDAFDTFSLQTTVKEG
jgi:hypothetical protein